jgi:hypothetical protein
MSCSLSAARDIIEKVIEQASLEDRTDIKEELDKAKDLLASTCDMHNIKA